MHYKKICEYFHISPWNLLSLTKILLSCTLPVTYSFVNSVC